MASPTAGWKLNHTMLRIKDPKEELKFWELLGMKLLDKLEQPEAKFDLYFLGYDSAQAVSHGAHRSDREGVIELTHNYGTEDDPNYKVQSGNDEPYRGFGHVCISVDNLVAAQTRLLEAGVPFRKKLEDGRQHNIFFALSPSGYWVEGISWNDVEKTKDVKTTDVATYRMNHTMLRIKSLKSLDFFTKTLGMTLIREHELPGANATLYFLSCGDLAAKGNANQAEAEGLLELTYNHGTETDEQFKYHNGNDEPQGFGHIALSVPDIEKACAYLEGKVAWKKRLTDGRMKSIAFILTPEDGYWIEIVPIPGSK